MQATIRNMCEKGPIIPLSLPLIGDRQGACYGTPKPFILVPSWGIGKAKHTLDLAPSILPPNVSIQPPTPTQEIGVGEYLVGRKFCF